MPTNKTITAGKGIGSASSRPDLVNLSACLGVWPLLDGSSDALTEDMLLPILYSEDTRVWDALSILKVCTRPLCGRSSLVAASRRLASELTARDLEKAHVV